MTEPMTNGVGAVLAGAGSDARVGYAPGAAEAVAGAGPGAGPDAVARPVVHTMPALDGARALAAALVFLVHYVAAFQPVLGPADGPMGEGGHYISGVGYQGVNIFFVLSGFLIYGSLLDRPVPLRRFVQRRVRRIYPTYLVMLALYVALSLLIPSRSKLPQTGAVRTVVENALLLPGLGSGEPIIAVSWSLSFEIVFYLVLPVLVTGLGMRRWSRRGRVALWAALCIAWAVAGEAVPPVMRIFIMFIPGLLLFEFVRSGRAERLREATRGAPTWIAFFLGIALSPLWGRTPIAGWLIAANTSMHVFSTAVLAAGTSLLLLHAVHRGTSGLRLLEHPWMRFLGVSSYSFYLIHGLTINAVAAVFWGVLGSSAEGAGALAFVALMPPVYLACVAASAVLFRTVERPLSL